MNKNTANIEDAGGVFAVEFGMYWPTAVCIL